MIDHLSSYATDFEATRRFYDAVLGSLGYAVRFEMEMSWDTELPGRKACAFGPEGRSIFWVIQVRDAVSPRHVAFTARDRARVDSFHRAALEAGGTDNGPPGLRPIYHEHYYGAFVLDPDGNNVEAVCHASE